MEASYDDYVDHPRWGRKPRRTKLQVDSEGRHVRLLWHNGRRTNQPHRPASRLKRSEWGGVRVQSYTIANTAVEADRARQDPSATFGVTHYYDQDKQCLDCHRRFIFFAIEQKHWYETLKFSLDADCVRCFPCRMEKREPRLKLARYQELLEQPKRDDNELLELIDLYLGLVKDGEFTRKRLDRVRQYSNQLSEKARAGKRHAKQFKLLRELETESPGR